MTSSVICWRRMTSKDRLTEIKYLKSFIFWLVCNSFDIFRWNRIILTNFDKIWQILTNFDNIRLLSRLNDVNRRHLTTFVVVKIKLMSIIVNFRRGILLQILKIFKIVKNYRFQRNFSDFNEIRRMKLFDVIRWQHFTLEVSRTW